jgi:hypothetical protein
VSAVRSITVAGDGGTVEQSPGATLSQADLTPPSDFNDPTQVPVVASDGTNIEYFRPWRGGRDVNARDAIQGDALSFSVFEGQPLGVTVHASATTVDRGGSVTFSATVSGAGSSSTRLHWQFDGGAPATTATTPAITFTRTGTFDVTVLATDSAGAAGEGSILVTVGTVPPARNGSHPRSGHGPSRRSSTPTGPTNSNGNGGSAPTGNTSPETTTSPSPSAHHNTSPATSSRPAPQGRVPAHPSRPATQARRRPRATRTSTGPAAAGRLVSGELIADVVPLPAAASPLVHPVQTASAAAPARQAIRASRLPALAAVAVIVLLLGLGARRELRGRDALRF